PDTRSAAPAHAPWAAVIKFAGRKPLGAMGGLIVLALVLTALLAPLISPHDPRQIIREANNRVPVYVAPGPGYPLGTPPSGRDSARRAETRRAGSSAATGSRCTSASAPS